MIFMIFICCFKWDSQVVIIIITSGGHYHRARPRKRASSPSCTGDYPLDISFVCWDLFVRKGWEEETEEAAHDRATTFRPHIRWWAPPYIVAHCISFLICINFFLMGCVLFSPCVYQNTWTCVLILSDSKSSSNETSGSCPLHLRCVCVVVSSFSRSGQVDFRKLSGCLSNVHDVCDFSHQDGSMKTVIRWQ